MCLLRRELKVEKVVWDIGLHSMKKTEVSEFFRYKHAREKLLRLSEFFFSGGFCQLSDFLRHSVGQLCVFCYSSEANSGRSVDKSW